jgi:hypothetical protein
MKYLATILITVSLCQIAQGQDDYDRYIQALVKRDTVLMAQIEKKYADENTFEPIKEYPFPVKNIPEHVFKLNINALIDLITTFFKTENSPEQNKILRNVFYFCRDTTKRTVSLNAEQSKDATFGENYFSQEGTSDDIYLTVFNKAWISKFYYSTGQPISYTADFVFKLKRIDENLTDVKVVAVNPEIIIGMGLGVHGPMNIYTKAQPTTIEEYSLLLFIADKLGDTTLSPLKLPISH